MYHEVNNKYDGPKEGRFSVLRSTPPTTQGSSDVSKIKCSQKRGLKKHAATETHGDASQAARHKFHALHET